MRLTEAVDLFDAKRHGVQQVQALESTQSTLRRSRQEGGQRFALEKVRDQKGHIAAVHRDGLLGPVVDEDVAVAEFVHFYGTGVGAAILWVEFRREEFRRPFDPGGLLAQHIQLTARACPDP